MSWQLRVILGCIIFACLALHDLKKNGRRATRWREYSFLVLAVLVALIYGAVNDQITSTISWEYFYYGKELDKILGPQIPPDPLRLHIEAAIVGIQATWSTGLIAGAAMLIANNAKPSLPQLTYRQLTALLPRVLLITIAFAIFFGVLGYLGALTFLGEDFRDLERTNMWRPRHFMTTWGIHLGGYIGGIVSIFYCVFAIRRRRRKIATVGDAPLSSAAK